MGKRRGKKKGPKGVAFFNHQGNMPPFMKDLCSDNRNMPPWIREPFADEMWEPGEDMPPWMCGPCPEEEKIGLPWMRDSFPGEISWGNGHPQMRGPFLEEMYGPRGNMGAPFPEMCGPRGNMGASFPEMCGPRGNMGAPFPEMCGPRGNMGAPFPEMYGPQGKMGAPFQEELCGPQRNMGGPFLGEMYEPQGNMGGSFPEQICGPQRSMGGPFPEQMCEPWGNMGGPFPHEMCGPQGNRGGPFPEEMCGPQGNSGGPFPEEICGPQGNMLPQMGGPFSREKCRPGRGMHPQMRDFCQGGLLGPQVNMSLEVRAPCLDHSQKPGENMPLQKHGPNSSDPQPRPIVASREGSIRRPVSSPVIRQQQMNKHPSCSGNDSLPPGNSSGQLPSGRSEEYPMNDHNHYLQEGAAKILETFGLSSEDLDELCRYPDDQLKPENMPAVLEDLRKRKMAEKMKNCPAPSMMNDYFSVSPRLFPHTCSVCKIETKHLEGWSLHLSSIVHSENCHLLRQQYPHWNPEDSFWLQRYKSEKNTNYAHSRQPASSSHTRSRTRSRSRSPSLNKTIEPRPQHSRQPFSPSRTSRSLQSSHNSNLAEPPAKAEHKSEQLGRKSKPAGELQRQDLSHQEEQPKDGAASQELPHGHETRRREEQSSSAPPPSALSSLLEKSVVQAMALFQPAGAAAAAGLAPGTSGASLPSVQLDPSVVSQGLLSMVQLVVTQVVQDVLASREVSAGQTTSSGMAHVSPQSRDSASHKEEEEEKQEEKQAQAMGSLSLPAVQDSEEPPCQSEAQGQRTTKESQCPMVDVPVTEVQGTEDESTQSSSRVGCSVPTAGLMLGDRRVRVLLIGNDIIYWAARRAATSPWGTQLGVGARALLKWKGRCGMTCSRFLPCLFEGNVGVPPDVIVIHLGGNDFGKMKGIEITMAIKYDLVEIRRRWPAAVFVWSEIIPRMKWKVESNVQRIDRARRQVNKVVSSFFAEEGLGTVVAHPEIRVQRPELYQANGANLTLLGLDIFLNDLHWGLKTELDDLGKARGISEG